MLSDIFKIKSAIENGDILELILGYLLLLLAIPIIWNKLFHQSLLHRKYLFKYLLLAGLFLLYLVFYVMGILPVSISILLLFLFIGLVLVFIYSSKGKILWPCSSICSAVNSHLQANEPNEAEKLLQQNKWLFLDPSERLRYYSLAAEAAAGLSDIRRSFELLMNVDITGLNTYEWRDLTLQKAGYAIQLGDYKKADLIVEKLSNLSGEHLVQSNVIKALSAQFKGDFEECSELLLNALSEGSDLPQERTYRIAQNNFGQIREIEGNFTEAILYYKKALSCAKQTGDKRSLHIEYQNVIHLHLILKEFHEAKQLNKEYYSVIDKKNSQDLMEYFNFFGKYCRQMNDKKKLSETFEEARERLYPIISREQQLSYDISQLRMRWNTELLEPAFLSQIENQYSEYSTLPFLERYHCYKELDHVLQALKERGQLTSFENLFDANLINFRQIVPEIKRHYEEVLQFLPDYCVLDKCRCLWDLATLEKINGPNYNRDVVIRRLLDVKQTYFKHQNYIKAMVTGLDLCDELLGQNRIKEMWECTQNSMEELKRITGHPEEASAFIRIACYAYNAGETEITKDYLNRFEEKGVQITHSSDWIQQYYTGLKHKLDTDSSL